MGGLARIVPGRAEVLLHRSGEIVEGPRGESETLVEGDHVVMATEEELAAPAVHSRAHELSPDAVPSVFSVYDDVLDDDGLWFQLDEAHGTDDRALPGYEGDAFGEIEIVAPVVVPVELRDVIRDPLS
jgi:hypothetical protein